MSEVDFSALRLSKISRKSLNLNRAVVQKLETDGSTMYLFIHLQVF